MNNSRNLATITAKQAFIRQTARHNAQYPEDQKIFWSRHAIAKLVVENLSRQEVEQALISCEIIEDYSLLTRPLPDCLILGWMPEQEPIHVVVALDEPNDRIFLVTIYRPDLTRWRNDYRIRQE